MKKLDLTEEERIAHNKAVRKTYVEKNREHLNQYQREYHAAKMKEDPEAYKAERREASRKWREKNREVHNKRCREANKKRLEQLRTEDSQLLKERQHKAYVRWRAKKLAEDPEGFRKKMNESARKYRLKKKQTKTP